MTFDSDLVNTSQAPFIRKMPEALRWSQGDSVFQAVHTSYVEQVSDAFGAHLRVFRTRSPRTGAQLLAAVNDLSNERLMRVLLAPETTSRLLHPQSGDIVSTAEFLAKSVAVEKALTGQQTANGQELWSAVGDVRVVATKAIPAPHRLARIPLDVESPYGDVRDVADSRRGPWLTLTGEEQRMVEERLRAAFVVITGVDLSWFVSTFTKVLMLRKESGDGFSSGSEGRYIGRSILGNPHDLWIDHLDLAEALVHEAIHSLLYMQEIRHRWVPPELHASVPHVVSPWTGRTLQLRPFLQACFVWYGILQFWSRVTIAANLPASITRRQIVRVAKGFFDGPLLELLPRAEFEIVAPEVRDAITEMQNTVLAALG